MWMGPDFHIIFEWMAFRWHRGATLTSNIITETLRMTILSLTQQGDRSRGVRGQDSHRGTHHQHTKIGIFYIPAGEVSDCRSFKVAAKCHRLYITSSQAFISSMNLLRRSHVSIFNSPCMHFSKLFWLCTFQSVYVGNLCKLQWAIPFPLAKTGTTQVKSVKDYMASVH